MLKQLIKKWLGLTELEEEIDSLQSSLDEVSYDVESKADKDDVDNVESEVNDISSDLDDIRSRLDDLEAEDD
tara:strand:+ start:91 stop:306 length:216 start_codon:yes stop_codon:yes gene_type:complete